MGEDRAATIRTMLAESAETAAQALYMVIAQAGFLGLLAERDKEHGTLVESVRLVEWLGRSAADNALADRSTQWFPTGRASSTRRVYEMERRAMLAAMTVLTGGVALDRLFSPGDVKLTSETLDHYRSLVDYYRHAIEHRPSVQFAASINHQADMLEELLHDAKSNIRIPGFSVYGELLSLQAWIAFDRRSFDMAAQYAKKAHGVGAVSGSQDLQAYGLGLLAYTSNFAGKPKDALRHVEAALRFDASPSTHAWLNAVGVESYSLLGSEYEVSAAVQRAERLMDHPVSEERPLAEHFTRRRLDGYTGTALLRLGRSETAERYLAQALTSEAASNSHSSVLLTDLATAQLDQGELALACETASRAIEIAAQRRSPFRLERFHTLLRKLDAFRSETPVKNLHEQVRTLLESAII